MTLEIRPQGAYFASRCPERVQLDVLWPCEPLPESEFMLTLFAAGDDYEEETIASLLPGVDGVVVVEGEERDDRQRQTLRALDDGAAIIVGGRLPVDDAAHRAGEPDLLVRHGGGYVPVDVKSHKALTKVKEPGTGTARVSDLGAPFPDAATELPDFDPRKHTRDLLQLAHYRRLLEAAGYATPTSNVGGIYGNDGVVVWYDLDQPWLNPSEYLVSAPDGLLSAMERYDLEFAHRLEVHVAAQSHLVDDTVSLLAEPIMCDQCAQCRWWDWCSERLDQSDDLSQIFGIGAARRRLFMEHGVRNLHDLAALDWSTAELLCREVDLDDLTAKAAGLDAATPLAAVIPNRTAQLETLTALGFHTVADLAAVDSTVLDLCREGASNLATQIELARARTGPAGAYVRRECDRVEVPRADVEVDVDMENTNDGCYLWGALVTDNRTDAPSCYVAFASWDPNLASGELVAFQAFWTWFTDLRAQTTDDDASFRAYCYSRSAEEGQMKRIADRLGRRAEVDAFIGSEDWVDLYAVVKNHLVTGRSQGLKVVAPLAGFGWTSDEAGGTQAMVAFEVAVDDSDPVAQAEAQRWILEYNEDDVRATAVLRDWLDGPANELPSIADWP